MCLSRSKIIIAASGSKLATVILNSGDLPFLRWAALATSGANIPGLARLIAWTVVTTGQIEVYTKINEIPILRALFNSINNYN